MEVGGPTINYNNQPFNSQIVYGQTGTSRPNWDAYRPQAGDVLRNFHGTAHTVTGLPSGLSINPSTGVISGTYVGMSDLTFRIQGEIVHAGMAAPVATTADFFTVGQRPVIWYAFASNGQRVYAPVGTPSTVPAPDLTLNGAPLPSSYTVSYSLDSGSYPSCQAWPRGMTLDAHTGVLSGTPSEPTPINTDTGMPSCHYWLRARVSDGNEVVDVLVETPLWIYQPGA